MATGAEAGKKRAAEAAAGLVEDGSAVGLGTGSIVAYLLPALPSRHLSLRCESTSPETKREATALGIHVEPFTLGHARRSPRG